jgi:molybdopterin-guanine dinucleotide biosynthesis protein A
MPPALDPHNAGKPHETFAAVILAGGKGERLGGVIKANLSIGGVRLLDRVTGALGAVEGPVLVAHGRIDPALLGLLPRHIAVVDGDGPQKGPLAGIAAAAGWCLAQARPPALLLSVAVDTPFFPPDFSAAALALLDEDTDVVVAAYLGQPYPTNALWRIAALRGLLQAPESTAKTPGIKDFAATLRSRQLDWPDDGFGDPFANLNTEADRLALERRALRQ